MAILNLPGSSYSIACCRVYANVTRARGKKLTGQSNAFSLHRNER